MSEARALAHPNVALVKYWGKSNPTYNIPDTPSVSIGLEALTTETTVKESQGDQITIDGHVVEDQKILRWLDALRKVHEIPPVAITSQSNFPANSGLASSASGFAALAEAMDHAFDLSWDLQQKGSWARLGSASAARSITGSWSTLIPISTGSEDMFGCELFRIHDSAYWDLLVVIAITETAPKAISSTAGMKRSRETSPFYPTWVESTLRDFDAATVAIQNQDFSQLAEVAEHSCRKMHALMLSSEPPLRYWNSTTLGCLDAVEKLQNRNIPVFYSIDAGPQVKAICSADVGDMVANALEQVSGVRQVIQSAIGGGAEATH